MNNMIEVMFARKCSNCGCGMNSGYVWGDGDGYACSDECLFIDGYTEEIRDEDYENGCIYYTVWLPDQREDESYFTVEGKEIFY